MYKLTNLPMPPTQNDSYMPMVMRGTGRARLIPQKGLKDFHAAMEEWKKKNVLFVGKGREQIRDWLMHGNMLSLQIFVCFPLERIWTQDAKVRKFDATNRIKPLEDQLSELFQVDDSYFFKVSVEKIRTKRSEAYCIAVMRPHKPRGVEDIDALRLLHEPEA